MPRMSSRRRGSRGCDGLLNRSKGARTIPPLSGRTTACTVPSSCGKSTTVLWVCRSEVFSGYGTSIYRTWRSASHQQDAHTDENGHVSFPERTIRSSWLARTVGVISNTVSLNVHASYAPSAHVLAYGRTIGGKRLEGSAIYHAGEPLPEKLVTRLNDLHLK